MGFRGPEALKDNLEQRGDCQTRRKSYKATGIVGWVVGWKIDARSPYPNKGSGAAYACYCLSLTGSSHPQHFRPAFPEWRCASWTCLAPHRANASRRALSRPRFPDVCLRLRRPFAARGLHPPSRPTSGPRDGCAIRRGSRLKRHAATCNTCWLGSLKQRIDPHRASELCCSLGYIPAMPLFTNILTSTRRFSARPAFVSLGAVAPYSPIAPGATICRTGTPPCWIKRVITALARRSLSFVFIDAIPVESA